MVVVPDARHGWWSGAGLALSAGLAASALWWFFFSRYAESEGRKFLEAQLDDHRGLLLDEIEISNRRWRSRSLPRDVYPRADGFDRRYHRDLTDDLEKSTKYFFCGPTGVYVPARLHLRRSDAPPLEEVRLRIIDPGSPSAMERAVEDRARKRENEDKSAEELRQELLTDLAMTIVGVWEIRKAIEGPIRIWCEGAAVIKRVELFDRAVYDSSVDGTAGEAFPKTICWSSTQSSYAMHEEEFFALNRSSASLRIGATTRIDRLAEFLSALQIEVGDLSTLWDEYREEYIRYLEERLPEAREQRDVDDGESGPRDAN